VSRVLCVLLTSLLVVGAMTTSHGDEFQRLIQDLRSSDEASRMKAVKALGQSGEMRALNPLLEALKDDSALVREHALEALRNLVKVLSDVYRLMRWWFQDLLNRLGISPQERVIPVEKPVRT
jgi:HEAT repeat protein